jgi:hypothetical protein
MSTVVQQIVSQKLPGNGTGKWSRWFVLSAGGILLITSLAKIVSAFGKAKVLENTDPVFGISFGHLMLSVGILELAVSGICLLTKKQSLSLGLTAWLATCFLAYRGGLWYLGWQRPCSCLGNLTDALHISPHVADVAMKIVLIYLLVGSYGGLLWLWKLNRKST